MALKSLKQISKEQRQLVRQVNLTYRKTMAIHHATYNAAFDETMAKHGLTIPPPTGRMGRLAVIHNFPPEFHADMLPAKQAFLKAKAAADAARATAARSVSPAVARTRAKASYAPSAPS
jgi:hypothetical protein